MAHVATPCQPDSGEDNSIVRLLCCEGKFLVMYVDLAVKNYTFITLRSRLETTER